MKFKILFVALLLNVLAFAQPTASFSISDNVLCEGDCIDVENTSTDDVVASTWTFGGGTPSFYSGMNPGEVCFLTAGTYTLTLTVTDGSGATSSASQVVTVGSMPSVSITVLDSLGGTAIPDTLIAMYGSAVIAASGFTPGDSLQWYPSNNILCVNSACDTIVASPFYATYYVITNTSPEGCVASDTVFVDVLFRDSVLIAVPDGFSPNGDGKNDVLRVITNVDIDAYYPNGFNGEGGAIVEMNFEVYNRYGQLVFRTTDPHEGWDGTFKGKNVNPATFLYKLEYRLINTLSGSLNGNVTLYR